MWERVRNWFHRHIVADAELSKRLDAIDQDVDRREMEGCVDRYLRKDRAQEYMEQLKECGE